MKIRMITSAVLILLMVVLLFLAPKIVAAVAWGLMMGIAAYELLYCTGLVKEPRLVIYSCVMAFAVVMWSYFDAVHAFGILLLMLFLGILFAEMMMDHVKITFDKIAMCMVAGALIPYLQGSLIRILVLKIGRYMILIPFIVACVSDAGAYLTGMFFGKHKMAPVISPHKTVEGAVGGVISAVVAMLIYTFVLDLPFENLNFKVNYLYAIIYGLLGSLVGILGDLCFSVIKRQTGIKDYGSLFPGHGGILDRFDSMMMVGPLMEALLILLPIVTG